MPDLSIINPGSIFGWSGMWGPGFGVVADGEVVRTGKPELGEANVGSTSMLQLVPRVSGPGGIDSAASYGGGWAGCATGGGIPLEVGGIGAEWSPAAGLAYTAPGYRLYSTYRRMDDDPDLQEAIRLTVDPILMGVWTMAGVDKDVPAAWVDEVRQQVMPGLQRVLTDAVRALSYGFQPFEKIWERRDGKLKCSLKPHFPEYCQIFKEMDTGRYAGLRVAGFALDVLPPNKTLVVTYNGEAGNLYGHSKHDAAWDAFCQWQRTQLDLIKLRAKLSGVLPTLKYPPGQTPMIQRDGTTKNVDNHTIAQQILSSLNMGHGVALPAVGYNAKQIGDNPALAKVTLWELTFQDNGTLSPAISGYLEVLNYYGTQKMRAWGVPESTGQDSDVGTYGKSKSHAENSITSKELIASWLGYTLSHGDPVGGVTGWVDDILLYNFGPKAVGQVELRCAPLADNKLDYKAQFIQQLLASTNPPMATAIMRRTDMEQVLSDIGLQSNGEAFDADQYQQDVADQQQQQQDADAAKAKMSAMAKPTGAIVKSNGAA